MKNEVTGGRVVARLITVRGIVQGVGFRPFVYNLATRLGLSGSVRNTSHGVEIYLEGDAGQIAEFQRELKESPPPLAQIDGIDSKARDVSHLSDFIILESQPEPGEFQPVPADIAICDDCRRELFDPSDRRYRYPFINCTNCGPRFTIIHDLPYDRPLTSMASFPLCPDCQAEYEDPSNRRFHAQPVACPVCGPKIVYAQPGMPSCSGEDALAAARGLIVRGGILALKGLGGYHLACDATNDTAVENLKQRKHRSQKPLAVMAFALATIEKYCRISPRERELLESSQHPIVLLDRLDGPGLADGIASGVTTYGFMLPYTPLHLLLCEPAPGFPEVLVMTSGNLSEEPIAFEDADAMTRLSAIADGFLTHDRPIVMRVDDSVVRVIDGAPYPLRRARGYAPNPLVLERELPRILGVGAELKSAFCLSRGRYAFTSHYIGDLENYETLRAYEAAITHYEQLFKIQPEAYACDLHPDYLSTRYARDRACREELPLFTVQHHHAHLAAVLAENGWPAGESVIGLTFDGTGLGTDGTIWGGEVLVGDYAGFERITHLQVMPLPGGDAAIRRPARIALAYLATLGFEWQPELVPVQFTGDGERKVLSGQLAHAINTTMTSSLGRLFDAVSALAGICEEITFEGQAAIQLEGAIDPQESGAYPLTASDGVIGLKPLFAAILADLAQGASPGSIAARFHHGLANFILEECSTLKRQRGLKTVALSGGVWQNRSLLLETLRLLRGESFEVLIHQQLPPNDGCIALGQVLVAAQQMNKRN